MYRVERHTTRNILALVPVQLGTEACGAIIGFFWNFLQASAILRA